MSRASSRGYASYDPDDGEDNLRSKRSSITIECSDGSKVVFVRPRRPRLGSSSVSQSPSSSPTPAPPPPPASISGENQGEKQKRGRTRSRRHSSMPAQSSMYDDIYANPYQSNRESLPNSLPENRIVSPPQPTGQRYPAPYAPGSPSHFPIPGSRGMGTMSPVDLDTGYNIETPTRRNGQEETPKPHPSAPSIRSDRPRSPSSVHGETGRETPPCEENEGFFLSTSSVYASAPPPPRKEARHSHTIRTRQYPELREDYFAERAARPRYVAGVSRDGGPLARDEPPRSRGVQEKAEVRYYRDAGNNAQRRETRSLEGGRRYTGGDNGDVSGIRGKEAPRRHESEDEMEREGGCLPICCCWPFGSRRHHKGRSRPRSHNQRNRRH